MFISAFMSVRLTFKSDHSAMCSAFECEPVNNVVFAGEHQLIVLRRKMQGRVRLTNSDRWFLIQLYRWFRDHERRQQLGSKTGLASNTDGPAQKIPTSSCKLQS
jgi:hypothetical protein